MRKHEYQNLSDEEILSLLKGNDELAFKELYDRYHFILYVVALKRLQNKEECRDIIQNIFLTTWQNRQQLEISGKIFNYLYTSVRNAVINFISKDKTRKNYLSSIDLFAQQYEPVGADYKTREHDFAAVNNHNRHHGHRQILKTRDVRAPNRRFFRFCRHNPLKNVLFDRAVAP